MNHHQHQLLSGNNTLNLSHLCTHSMNKLQLISYNGYTVIKSISNQWMMLRLVIFSMLGKIYRGIGKCGKKQGQFGDASQGRLEKIKEIVYQGQLKYISNNKGIQRNVLLGIVAKGLYEMEEKMSMSNTDEDYSNYNNNNNKSSHQQQLIKLFNCTPFFDEIIMTSVMEHIQYKYMQPQQNISEQHLINFLKQQFNYKLRIFKTSSYYRFFKDLKEEQENQIKLMKNDQKHSKFTGEYLRLSLRQLKNIPSSQHSNNIIQKQTNQSNQHHLITPNHINNQNQFNSQNKQQQNNNNSNNVFYVSTFNSTQQQQQQSDINTDMANNASSSKLLKQNQSIINKNILITNYNNMQSQQQLIRISQTPNQTKKSQINLNNYILQTIQDSVTQSPLFFNPNNKQTNSDIKNVNNISTTTFNPQKQNIANQQQYGSNIATINKNTNDSITNHPRNKIIRRKTKMNKNQGGIWSFLCCT